MKNKEVSQNFDIDKVLDSIALKQATEFSINNKCSQMVIAYHLKDNTIKPIWYSLPNNSIKTSDRIHCLNSIKRSINQSSSDITITTIHLFVSTEIEDEDRIKLLSQIDASYFEGSSECVIVQVQIKGSQLKKSLILDVIRDGEKNPYLDLDKVLRHDNWNIWVDGMVLDWFN